MRFPIIAVVIGMAGFAVAASAQERDESRQPVAAAPANAPLAVTVRPPATAPGRRGAAGDPGPEGAGGGRGSDGNRVFLGLGPKPDLATALRGEPIFQANCASCHGADARGTDKGSNLILSPLVITDTDGSQVGPVIRQGRGAMPAFANFTAEQMHQLQQYMAQLVEDVANRGTYSYLPNLHDGVASAGKDFFDRNCAACHSAAGDLKGFGKGKKYEILQRAWMAPRGTQTPTVTVTSGKEIITGKLQSVDDFDIFLIDAGGQVRDIPRGRGVSYVVDDKMAAHNALVVSLTNADMHNVTAYLETLQ